MMGSRPETSDKEAMTVPLPRLHVTVPDRVITRAVGASTVLLDVDSGRSFSLDAVGARVWNLLTSTGSAQDTLAALLREFDADPLQVEDDLRLLITELADGRLIEVHEQAD
jgi:hypothetical protein